MPHIKQGQIQKTHNLVSLKKKDPRKVYDLFVFPFLLKLFVLDKKGKINWQVKIFN